MILAARTVVVAFAVLASTVAFADDPARLSKDDVQKTIEGKTMVYLTPMGTSLRVYYSADGRLTGRGAGTGKSAVSSGDWKIEDDGKVCVVIKQGPMTDRCFFIMRADSALSMTAGKTGSVPFTIE